MRTAAQPVNPNPDSVGRHRWFRNELAADSFRHLRRSLEKQGRRYRKELKRCQKNFSEKSVHELRVAARRLLSTVELLGVFLPRGRVRKIEKFLKRHLDSFDDLRDTQVQLASVANLPRAFLAARPFNEWLLSREKRFIEQSRKRIKSIKARPLAKQLAACQEILEEKQKNCKARAAAALILRCAGRAFARAARLRSRIRASDPRTIHRTRVAFKRFRYMIEVLAPCLPGADEQLLERMGEYQGQMGYIQDAVVLLATLNKFLRKHEIASESADHLREELVRRRRWLIRVYLKGADQLDQFW